MKRITTVAMLTLVAALSLPAYADHDDDEREYWYRAERSPDIDVWTNKGDGARYYFGEDVAVYFRADDDCYVVVYDVDPSGRVTILFPASNFGSSYVEGGRVYRMPDYDDEFRLEIAGASGKEHIFAVASYDYINPPDFMQYVGYEYGEDSYYDDDYFAIRVRGDIDEFVGHINARICSGPHSVVHTGFIVDTHYRHHRHYRYWDYDPYYVGSIWVGCDNPGAEIWIDGVFIGIAPILVPRVIVGYHWMWVYYGGYPCYQRYFYVPSYQRYYIDVRVDRRYNDHNYGRRVFRDWVFEEKKYRNEDDFKDRAREIRQKNIRTRSLPPTVIRDYADRGVLSKDAPIVKKVRVKDDFRDSRPSDGGRDFEKPRIDDNDSKGSRTKSNDSWRDDANRKPEKKGSDWNTPGGFDDEGRVIVPERKPETEKSKPADGRDNSGKKPQRQYDNSDNRESQPERGKGEFRGGSSDDSGQVKGRQYEPRKESSGDERKEPQSVEKKKSSGSSQGESDKGGERKESRSSKTSKAQGSKERGR